MKQWLIVLACLFLFGSSVHGMDRFKKVMLRDTLIGAGAGIVIGLLMDEPTTWFLVGGISGAIFGYIDADKGLWTYRDGKMQFRGIPVIHASRQQTPAGHDIRYHTTLLSAAF